MLHQFLKYFRLANPSIFVALLTLALLSGCSGGGGKSSSTTDTNATTTGNTNGAGTTPAQPGAVANKLEQVGNVQYKTYSQSGVPPKGIVLLGSGGNDSDPKTGQLELPWDLANELAKLGYVAAIVAYQDQPPVGPNYVNWDSNCQMLATDFSEVANDALKKYAPNLSLSKVVVGGMSYTTFCLLTNIAMSDTLADTKGVLAACGGTSKTNAQNFKVPIYSIHCPGTLDSDPAHNNYNGKDLFDAINPNVKDASGFYTDNACTEHCNAGGDMTQWTAKAIDQIQLWLP